MNYYNMTPCSSSQNHINSMGLYWKVLRNLPHRHTRCAHSKDVWNVSFSKFACTRTTSTVFPALGALPFRAEGKAVLRLSATPVACGTDCYTAL